MTTTSKKLTWPFTVQQHYFQDEFKAHLHSGGLGESSLDINVQGVNYFFSLLDISFPPGQAENILSVMQVLQNTGLMRHLLCLPILDPSIPWTRKILDACTHLADFTLIQAIESENEPALKAIQHFQLTYLQAGKGPKKRCNKEKTISALRRNEKDADRI